MSTDPRDGANPIEKLLKFVIASGSKLDQEVVLACDRMRFFNLFDLLESLDESMKLLVLRRDESYKCSDRTSPAFRHSSECRNPLGFPSPLAC